MSLRNYGLDWWFSTLKLLTYDILNEYQVNYFHHNVRCNCQHLYCKAKWLLEWNEFCVTCGDGTKLALEQMRTHVPSPMQSLPIKYNLVLYALTVIHCLYWEINCICMAIIILWWNRDVLIKLGEVFQVQESSIYGIIFLQTQRILAVCASLAHQLV